MKLLASSVVCLASLLLPLSALAGEARFFESTNIKFKGSSTNYLTNEVIFDCSNNVKGTVIELSKAGWKMKRQRLSPALTTRLNDAPVVHLK